MMLVALAAGVALSGCAARQPSRSVLPFQPDAARRDLDAGFDEAVALAAEGRYDAAAERFTRLARMYEYQPPGQAAPDTAGGTDARDLRRGRAAEAVFWLGYCREKQGLLDDAAALYRRVIDAYGDAPAARQARLRLGHLAAGRNP